MKLKERGKGEGGDRGYLPPMQVKLSLNPLIRVRTGIGSVEGGDGCHTETAFVG